MKQYSTSELGRALTEQEKNILSLEKKYMGIFIRFFKKIEFLNNFERLKKYIQTNYEFINNNYDKKNKIDIAIERLLRFHIYKNFESITGIYPSPISSDIAFETEDAIINIDSKTVDKVDNFGDFKSFHFENNQSSFKQNPIGKTNHYDGLSIKTTLPSIDPSTKKALLNFVVRVLYYDNYPEFYYYKDNEYKNLSLTCLPNGELSSLFKNNIIINCKTYTYYKNSPDLTPQEVGLDNVLRSKGIYLGNDYSSFKSFKNDIIKSGFRIPDHWNKKIRIISRYGFYDEKNNVGWVIKRKGVGSKNNPYKRVFYAIKSGHTTRVDYSTLRRRLDINNNPWIGHVGWNIR